MVSNILVVVGIVSRNVAFVIQHSFVLVAGSQLVGLFQVLVKSAAVDTLLQSFVNIFQQFGVTLSNTDNIAVFTVGNFTDNYNFGVVLLIGSCYIPFNVGTMQVACNQVSNNIGCLC